MDEPGAHKQRVAEVFDRSAATYDDDGVWLFPRLARVLVVAAGVRPGESVLDVATGTGQVLLAAAEAVGPAGRVVGVDLSQEMLARARAAVAGRGLANAELRPMDAEHLAFPDAAFDRVLCGFGLFFLPDPVAALRDFRRVLRPGGTAAATTFAVSPATTWLRDLARSLGVRPVRLVSRPFDTPEELVGAFAEAGFEAPRVEQEEVWALHADEEAWWRSLWAGSGRATMDAMDEATRARLKAAAFEGLGAYRGPRGIRTPRPVLVTTARRPPSRAAAERL